MPSMFGHMKEARAWQNKYNLSAPKEGDIAPDFKLRDINGENQIRLSEFKGVKPVGLIFGSHT